MDNSKILTVTLIDYSEMLTENQLKNIVQYIFNNLRETLTDAMPINQNQVPLNSQMLSQDINTNRIGINQATALNSNIDQNSNNSNINFQDLQTLANFVKTQIGKNATIEFLIGENSLIEKTGTIVSVGENYVLLNESSTRNLIACDLRSIKFIYFEY